MALEIIQQPRLYVQHIGICALYTLLYTYITEATHAKFPVATTEFRTIATRAIQYHHVNVMIYSSTHSTIPSFYTLNVLFKNKFSNSDGHGVCVCVCLHAHTVLCMFACLPHFNFKSTSKCWCRCDTFHAFINKSHLILVCVVYVDAHQHEHGDRRKKRCIFRPVYRCGKTIRVEKISH